MQTVRMATGCTKQTLTLKQMAELPPERRNSVNAHGVVHSVRDMGGFAFLILRCPDGLLQCVWDKDGSEEERRFLREECAVKLTGELVDSPKAQGGHGTAGQDSGTALGAR
ncbi:hypothetical protein LJC63_09295 [Ruminococcaceae bacterium OttesenSCG-928-L11]|nr:hypothetical protein [Ruminococcaceae bacterium OttesenSCG-928-L11]